MTGEQSGLVTDSSMEMPYIICETKEDFTVPEAGLVPVVAGFQGMGENGELTTLGRGSDTTASVLGVALNTEYIDIFTDGKHYDRRPRIEDAGLSMI